MGADISLYGDLLGVNAINEVTTDKIGNMISVSLVRPGLDPFTSALHSCGIDPNIRTAADMSALDPIIECLGCANMSQGRVILRWSSVVSVDQRL